MLLQPTRFSILLATVCLSLFVNAQTLYVPSGTSGIGTSSGTPNTNIGFGTSAPSNYLAGTNGLTLFGTYPGLAFARSTKTWLFWANTDNSFRLWENTGVNVGADRVTVLAGGNVGIGTTNPAARLEVNGSPNQLKISSATAGQESSIMFSPGGSLNSWQMGVNNAVNGNGWFLYENNSSNPYKMVVTQSGNVGINTVNPISKLQIGDNFGKISFDNIQSNAALDWNSFLQGFNITRSSSNWTTGADGVKNGATVILSNSSGDLSIACVPSSGTTPATLTDANITSAIKLKILSSGSVGINTTYIPWQYKLAVNGAIICEEVNVKLRANWPDYVFKNGYKLISLRELECFVNKEKHLPEIPSSEEMEKNGIPIGEMQNKQMKKIEELTLYIIQMNKDIQQLKLENELIKKKQNNTPIIK